MRARCLATLLFSVSASSRTLQGGRGPPNARHIFNAVHSSMRQWGSSWNHNGMSFFLATVPEGTQFYHGTQHPERVNGTEWLAFEPEHAMLFAVSFGNPPTPPGNHPRGSGKPPGDPEDHDQASFPSLKRNHPAASASSSQLRIQAPPNRPRRPPGDRKPGWLHTYTTSRDLNLLYVDGMSAGKSNKGTLDTQDYILNPSHPDKSWSDRERAQKLCDMAENRWAGRVDGILRMEAGFEIILCSFNKSLDVTRITRGKGLDEGSGPAFRFGENSQFAYYQAITARYHGIGGRRVAVNYDNFVTAYSYEDINLFTESEGLPRLQNVSEEYLDQILADVDDLVMKTDMPDEHNFDWQAVADAIILRYANRLQALASGNFSSMNETRPQLESLLRPFIDYDDRNNTAEIERCAMQFLPTIRSEAVSLAEQAIYSTSYHICSTLSSAMAVQNVDAAIGLIQDLIKDLDWTVWKECQPGCAAGEICFIPIWPHGRVEDREHPSCVDATGLAGRRGYWR